jgi:hypothetical protein
LIAAFLGSLVTSICTWLWYRADGGNEPFYGAISASVVAVLSGIGLIVGYFVNRKRGGDQPPKVVPVIEPVRIVKNTDRSRKRKATPTLGTQRETIREKSAKEIVDNLKGIRSSEFHEKVKSVYIGRWTREPGWHASVKTLPSKVSGGEHWFCSLKEVDSGTIIYAITVQDISMLRTDDTVTVSGRIRTISRDECVNLEDAEIQSDDVLLA